MVTLAGKLFPARVAPGNPVRLGRAIRFAPRLPPPPAGLFSSPGAALVLLAAFPSPPIPASPPREPAAREPTAVSAALAAPEPATPIRPGGPQPQQLRVAAVSFVPTKLDLAGNANRLEAKFRQAAAGGAKLAVAPEGILEGYVVNEILSGEITAARMQEVALPLGHPQIRRFQALARELDLCLVFGFAEKIGPDVFNAAVFIDHRGEIRGRYHKMVLAEGYHGDWWFNRVCSQSRAFDTPFGRCGVMICNDRWNPPLARIPALDGAQFLVIPSFGSKRPAQDEAVLSRARETGLPIVEANVGVMLIVSDGRVAALNRVDEGVTFAEIALPQPRAADPVERDRVEQEFLAWRAVEHARRFEQKKHRLHQPGFVAPRR